MCLQLNSDFKKNLYIINLLNLLVLAIYCLNYDHKIWGESTYSMCSLEVSTLDSLTVDRNLNPGSSKI